jgi:hypothetical protein
MLCWVPAALVPGQHSICMSLHAKRGQRSPQTAGWSTRLHAPTSAIAPALLMKPPLPLGTAAHAVQAKPSHPPQ